MSVNLIIPAIQIGYGLVKFFMRCNLPSDPKLLYLRSYLPSLSFLPMQNSIAYITFSVSAN